MRRTRGFSLIEAMIVIVLITGVAMITLNLLNAEQRRQQRNAMISEQANEMATITRAMEAYLESSDSLPDDLDTPFLLNPQELVDAGLLPVDYAYRPMSGRVTPTSPLGQEYLLIGVNTAEGYRGALLPAGDPSEGFMARAGLPGTTESMSEFGVAVMQRLKQDHLTAAGVTLAGTTQINRDVSGFSFDVSTLLAAAPDDPTVIALAGYPEFKPTPPIDVNITDERGESKECYTADTTNQPMTCDAGYELEMEYELCSDPSGPARSFVQTSAGRLEIYRNQTTTTTMSVVDPVWPGPGEEAAPRETFGRNAIINVPETSPFCPGTSLRADNYRRVNPGNGATYDFQLLWCVGDGQYHSASDFSRTAYSRSSGTKPDSAYYVLRQSPPGQGLTASPSGPGLVNYAYMEEGAVAHVINFTSAGVMARFRMNETAYYNAVGFNPEQAGSVFSSPTGAWTQETSLEPCLEGASNEAPVYLMSSGLSSPNNGKKVFAWSVGSSGAPVYSSNGTETIRIEGTTIVSNHSCGSRQLRNSHASCPTAYAGNRRMTTVISGGGGTRRVGVCCK